jgi:signal transduction histidine kinase
MYVGDKPIDSSVKTVLLQTVQLQSTVLTSSGNYLSIMGLSARDITIAMPVEDCNTMEAIGAVVHIPDIVQAIRRKQSLIFVYILVNAIILATLWFFRARRLVFSPLERLVEMSESYDLKSIDYIGSTTRKNEFGQLADALKNMLARIERDKEKLTQTVHSLEDANKQILENQNSLIEAEKFAAVGRLSAGLAHEIGNPLGIIQGYIELLGNDDIPLEDRRQYTTRAEKELSRVTALIQQLLELARKKTGGKSSTRVVPVIHELIEMMAQQKSKQHIKFHTSCDDLSERVQCSEAELHQVLLNCMLNSVDAINEQNIKDGEIQVSCNLLEEDSGKSVQIIIKDNGAGIDKNDLSVIFDPFFTTKAIGHGTGLGLSVSKSIIENCGGTIRLLSEKKMGTSVVIVIHVM